MPAKPVQPCPACHRPTPRLLGASSKTSVVNFYICDGCDHIWTTSRKTGEFIRHITRLPDTPPSEE